MQLGVNIARHDWDPLAGTALMEDYVRAANSLVDDQNCLNNYADACLNEASQHTNHSSKWKSNLSLDNPDIKAFIAKHNSVDIGGDGEDWQWKRCLKRDLGVRPKTSLSRVSDKENKLGIQSQESNGITKKVDFKFQAREKHGSELPSRHSVPAPPKSSVVNDLPTFDLTDHDIVEFDQPFEPVSEPNAKSSVLNSGILVNRPTNATLGNHPNQVKSSPNTATSFSDLITLKSGSSFGKPRPQSSDNLAPGPLYDEIVTRSSSIPPRPSFHTKSIPAKNVNNQQSQPKQAGSGPGCFKTAAQQLAIDRAKDGKKEGITQSSYGSGKRNLGTRPGPAGGFKPPVRNVGGEGGVVDRSREKPLETGLQGEEEEVDPRYKNIDMKMVELIKNEIMDAGEPITWDDIAGLQFAKEMVKEIVVWPMLRPDIFTGLRGPPKGLLLFGPPGTGKTLIGKCIACQSGSTFFSISASSLTSKWVGEGEKMVRALFAVAKVHQPSVVFIDEIDSLLTSRSEGEHESSRKIKTEFLVQLDGASTGGEERVLVVGATNRPQELDEAARRRLVKRLYIPLPELEARRRIIINLLGREKHELSEEEVEEVSRLTEGYSGADMANLCKEAAMGPIRSLDFSQIASVRPDQVRAIRQEDLVAALRQVKASVGQQDLELYREWDRQYGAGK